MSETNLFPRISSITQTKGVSNITVEPGTLTPGLYSLKSSPNLQTGPWKNHGSDVIVTTNKTTLADDLHNPSTAPELSSLFYQVVSNPKDIIDLNLENNHKLWATSGITLNESPIDIQGNKVTIHPATNSASLGVRGLLFNIPEELKAKGYSSLLLVAKLPGELGSFCQFKLEEDNGTNVIKGLILEPLEASNNSAAIDQYPSSATPGTLVELDDYASSGIKYLSKNIPNQLGLTFMSNTTPIQLELYLVGQSEEIPTSQRLTMPLNMRSMGSTYWNTSTPRENPPLPSIASTGINTLTIIGPAAKNKSQTFFNYGYKVENLNVSTNSGFTHLRVGVNLKSFANNQRYDLVFGVEANNDATKLQPQIVGNPNGGLYTRSNDNYIWRDSSKIDSNKTYYAEFALPTNETIHNLNFVFESNATIDGKLTAEFVKKQ